MSVLSYGFSRYEADQADKDCPLCEGKGRINTASDKLSPYYMANSIIGKINPTEKEGHRLLVNQTVYDTIPCPCRNKEVKS